MTPNEVKQMIMEHAQTHEMTLLDATIAIADELDIDLEEIAQHVTGSLKEMMQVECEADGMLKRESNSSFTFQ